MLLAQVLLREIRRLLRFERVHSYRVYLVMLCYVQVFRTSKDMILLHKFDGAADVDDMIELFRHVNIHALHNFEEVNNEHCDAGDVWIRPEAPVENRLENVLDVLC